MFGRHTLQMNLVKSTKKESTSTPTNPIHHEIVVHDVQQLVKESVKGVAGVIAAYVVLDTVRRAVDNLTR